MHAVHTVMTFNWLYLLPYVVYAMTHTLSFHIQSNTEYIIKRKMVPIEEAATEFGLRSSEVVDRIQV